MKNNTKECNRRIAAEGLEDLLTVKLMDYRDLPKCGMAFDRVVSVGMVEHVGRDHYPLFIDCVNKVMKPGGLFLLHFISALKSTPEIHGSRDISSQAALYPASEKFSPMRLRKGFIPRMWRI